MKKKTSVAFWKQLAVDVLIAGFILLNFAYFHHVKPISSPKKEEPTIIVVTEEQKQEAAKDIAFVYETEITENGSQIALKIYAQTQKEITASTFFVVFDAAKMSYMSVETGAGVVCDCVSVRQNEGTLDVAIDIDSQSKYVYIIDSTPEDKTDNCAVTLYFEKKEKQEVVTEDFAISVNPVRLLTTDNELATFSLSDGETVIISSSGNQNQFADKFTTGEIIETENSYISSNVNVSYEDRVVQLSQGQAACHIVDIYVKSYEYFRTALLYDEIEGGMNHAIDTLKFAKKSNAIAAINGDYCSGHSIGPVVKNGVLYRTEVFQDILVMYTDGTMKCFEEGAYADMSYLTGDIWQVWSFGPSLLDENGQVKTEFNSVLTTAHPRSAIGYYEPGHYCFVAIDGREMGGSEGMTLKEMSQFFYDLGCLAAYNLDGGRTSVAVFNDKIINFPYNGGRPCSDIVYIPRE